MKIQGINRMNWSTKVTYVDLETGEQITKRTIEETKREIKNKYIIIKIKKEIHTNEYKTKGLVEYTVQCRRNPQRELRFE